MRVFKQLLPALWASLDNISSWPGDASGKALLFTTSLINEFSVVLEILVSVLDSRNLLTVRLLNAAQHIYSANQNFCDYITTLQELWTDDTYRENFESRTVTA